MKFQNAILVTFVNPYEVDNSKGCSVNYFMLDENGRFNIELSGGFTAGQQSAKVSLPYELKDKFAGVPGIYNGSFVMATGSDRKPVLKLVDVEKNQDLKMTDIFLHFPEHAEVVDSSKKEKK